MAYVRIVIRNREHIVWFILIAVINFLVTWLYFTADFDRGPGLTSAKVIGTTGKYRLNGAMGVAVDDKGLIYIADGANDRIVVLTKFGFGNRIISTLKQKKGEQGYSIKFPTSIALANDKLYVGSYGTGQILLLDKFGKFIDSLPHQKDRQVLTDIKILALAADSKGNIYAADAGRQQIVVFDAAGNLKLVFGKQGFLPGQMNFVNGLAIDEANRRIIALDSNNLRLVYFNLEGKFLGNTLLDKADKELFAAPRGLAYDPGKKLFYITETLLDKVIVIDEKGNVVGKTDNIEFNYPHGIFMGPDKFLYVTNREGSDLYVLNPM